MTCTGHTYPINPGAPEEGRDIHHDRPCPAHPDAAERLRRARERSRVIADSKRKAEAARKARIADRDGVVR